MKTYLQAFTNDTAGLVSVDWIGIAAAATVSASSLIAHVQDMVEEPTHTINTAFETAIDQSPVSGYGSLTSQKAMD